MRTLRDASIGETVRVARVFGEGALRRRVMDMGITRGVEVTLRRLAPLGDPMVLTVRGYQLSIRKDDAARIALE